MKAWIPVATCLLFSASAWGAPPAPHKPRPSSAQDTYDAPVDHGPFTPEANRAYQGGGMILEGAPGAPPPRPEPTPPGQTPRNMVSQ
jgi:hypothetical protein